MGNTDVELEFEFVRGYYVYVSNEMPDWGTATYEDGPQLFPAGETVNIHCSPKNGGSFVRAWDDEEEFVFEYPDFSFTMPERNVYMIVEFEPLLYDLTVITDGFGDCSVSDYYDYDGEYDVYRCEAGSTVTVSAGAVEDNALTAFYVDGESVSFDPANPQISIEMDGDKTVQAIFKPLHRVRILNDNYDRGDITCSGITDIDITVKIAEGDTISFTCTPKTACMVSGMELSDPSGTGVLTASDSGGTFQMGTADAIIFVYFSPLPGHAINISAQPTEGGSWTISATPSFDWGDFPPGASFTVGAVPYEGYLFDHMEVSGGLTGEYTVNEMTFTMPDADVNIVFYYTLGDPHQITVTSVPAGVGDPVVSHETAMPGVTVTVDWGDTGEEYRFDSVTISGEYSELSVDEGSRRATFKMGNTDVTVTVNFTQLFFVSYMADPEASATVTWTPMKDSYEAGETINITVTAGDDYVLDSLSLNSAGYACGGLTSYAVEYTFGSEDLWIQVTSRKVIFHVYSYEGAEADPTYGEAGTTIYVTVPPDSNAMYVGAYVTNLADGSEFGITDVTKDEDGTVHFSFTLPEGDVEIHISWLV